MSSATSCPLSCPSHLPFSPLGSSSPAACRSLAANLFTVSHLSNRITAFSNDKRTHDRVLDNLNARDIKFVDPSNFFVTISSVNDDITIDEYDVSGQRIGTVLEGLRGPRGMVLLPELDMFGVIIGDEETINDISSGYTIFYSLSAGRNDGHLLRDDYLLHLLPIASFGEPRYMTSTTNPGEIFQTTQNQLIRRCVTNSACAENGGHALKAKYLSSDADLATTADLRGVAHLASRDRILVVDYGNAIVFVCPASLSTTMYFLTDSCPAFSDDLFETIFGASGYGSPYAVVADEARQLVYISEFDDHKIHVFDYDGKHLQRLETDQGSMINPTALAIQPGLFAPLSHIDPPPTSAAAGETLPLPLALLDLAEAAIATPLSFLERNSFTITARTDYILPDGTVAQIKLPGTATYDRTAAPTSSITGASNLTTAGTWYVDIEYGGIVKQHVRNSPLEVTILPATTEPRKAITTYKKVVRAGDEFLASLRPFDEYSNPTAHAADVFKCYLNSVYSGVDTFERLSDTGEFTFKQTMTKAASHRFHVIYAETNTEVEGSPFSFEVTAAEPVAKRSTHNMETVAGIEKTIDSTDTTSLTLQVFPKDEYGNDVTAAVEGYTADIVGWGIEGFDRAYPLASGKNPSYSEDFVIPMGFEATLAIVFKYNGVAIGDGNPVQVTIVPPEDDSISETDIYVMLFSVGFGGVIVFGAYKYLSSDSTDVNYFTKAKEIEKSWRSIMINGGDPVMDFTNWFILVRHCDPLIVGKVYLAFIIVSIFAAGLNIYNSLKMLVKLKEDSDELDLGAEDLDDEYKLLDAKFPGLDGKSSLTAILGVKRRKKKNRVGVDEEVSVLRQSFLPPTMRGMIENAETQITEKMIEAKEKKMLDKMRLIRRHKKVLFQKDRKKRRVISCITQVVVEDIPISLFNVLFFVFSECASSADSKSKLFFIGSTLFTVMFASRKWNEYRSLPELKANMENLKEVMALRLGELDYQYVELKAQRLEKLEQENPNREEKEERGGMRRMMTMKAIGMERERDAALKEVAELRKAASTRDEGGGSKKSGIGQSVKRIVGIVRTQSGVENV